MPVAGETGIGEEGGAAIGATGGGFIANAMAGPTSRMIANTADTIGAIMTIAVIGWLFLVMELMVAAPLWAAAHAYAEGEGFAPQQAMYGYGAAIGIVMRPVLLTFGFVFMFFLIFIVGHFVGGAMSVYMAGMNGFHLGVVGSVAVLAIILGTIWGSMKFLMGLITHLADQVPQWIGGRGQHLGEKENAIQGATSGSDKAKTVATGAYGVGRAVAGDVARKRGNRAAKDANLDESKTNASTNTGNIGGGEAGGKAEDKKAGPDGGQL